LENQGKTIAIIAHITLIGWIVAIIMNSNEKSDFASFYIRQLLGLFIIGIIGSFIPILGLIVGIAVLVLVIYSLVGAINNEKSITPFIGHLFQQWFSGL
jgi:hypothetical protein